MLSDLTANLVVNSTICSMIAFAIVEIFPHFLIPTI